MFEFDRRREQLRKDIEDWLERHRDPADPLTRPVELLLILYLSATSWRSTVRRTVVAVVTAAIIIVATDALLLKRPDIVYMPLSNGVASMQQWVDAGEAERLMRCEGDGLHFEKGRCHTTKDGGWAVPLPMQLSLEKQGQALKHGTDADVKPQSGAAHSSARTFSSPFADAR